MSDDPVGDSLRQWREHYRHAAAAIAEGLCPAHRTPLAPVTAKDGGPAGRCHCGWWHFSRPQAPQDAEVQWAALELPSGPYYPGWLAAVA